MLPKQAGAGIGLKGRKAKDSVRISLDNEVHCAGAQAADSIKYDYVFRRHGDDACGCLGCQQDHVDASIETSKNAGSSANDRILVAGYPMVKVKVAPPSGNFFRKRVEPGPFAGSFIVLAA